MTLQLVCSSFSLLFSSLVCILHRLQRVSAPSCTAFSKSQGSLFYFSLVCVCVCVWPPLSGVFCPFQTVPSENQTFLIAHLWFEERLRIGVVQLREEKAQGTVADIYTYLRYSVKKEGQTSQWCSLKVHDAKGTKSNIRKSFLNMRVEKAWLNFPETFCIFHFYSYSKSNWTKPWASCLVFTSKFKYSHIQFVTKDYICTPTIFLCQIWS